MALGATAQVMNRPIGQYPGNPREYYGPSIQDGRVRSGMEYMSKYHTVYQSSSWDFNLTSQLLTDGIIDDDIEKTIRNVGAIGSAGMKGADRMILDIMLCK